MFVNFGFRCFKHRYEIPIFFKAIFRILKFQRLVNFYHENIGQPINQKIVKKSENWTRCQKLPKSLKLIQCSLGRIHDCESGSFKPFALKTWIHRGRRRHVTQRKRRPPSFNCPKRIGIFSAILLYRQFRTVGYMTEPSKRCTIYQPWVESYTFCQLTALESVTLHIWACH